MQDRLPDRGSPMHSTPPRRGCSQFNRLPRRAALQAGGLLGLSLPALLQQQSLGAVAGEGGKAKSCIILYCWGGQSHIDTWDLKPDAPKQIRGPFKPIATNVPDIRVGEHIPRLARMADKLSIIRSVYHTDPAHGRGMYWNLTGHKPPPNRPGNIPPRRADWPGLAAMISFFRDGRSGVPRSIRLPYPMVDNGTLQAGEYGGFLGGAYDPIVVKTPKGKAYGGVSRDLGSPVLNLADGIDRDRFRLRRSLLNQLASPAVDVSATAIRSYRHFHELALDMLVSDKVQRAFDLDSETPQLKQLYGDHLGGQSCLLARRLVGAGVPVVQVLMSASDLNGGKGDHWDTHGNNFNRLKDRLLPVFDRSAAALITDLDQRGQLDETLVLMIGDFGRTPKINGGAGRDHYPFSFSVVLAGGGIRGGRVYGSSDAHAAHPHSLACGPHDVHATVFTALGIQPDTVIYDQLERPQPLALGQPLPLF
ncbi:MAG: hypothetical protein CMJ65_16470 [Planctomycetaceae bacterium]|nr:hypothetical protein [Planctomycetaceae bacterium]